MTTKRVTDLPKRQDAVSGNSVPSPPFLLITTIFPSKGILKLTLISKQKTRQIMRKLIAVDFHRRTCSLVTFLDFAARRSSILQGALNKMI